MKNLRFEFERCGGDIAIGMAGKCEDIVFAHNQLVNSGAVSNTAKCKKGRRGNESFLHWISGDETDKGLGFAYAVVSSIHAFCAAIVHGKLNAIERDFPRRKANERFARKFAAEFIRANRPKWVGKRKRDAEGQWINDPALRGFISRDRNGEALAEIKESDIVMASGEPFGNECVTVSRKDVDSWSMPTATPEDISAKSHTGMEADLDATNDDNPLPQEFEEPSDDFSTDGMADADALASAGFGTDEDYGDCTDRL